MFRVFCYFDTHVTVCQAQMRRVSALPDRAAYPVDHGQTFRGRFSTWQRTGHPEHARVPITPHRGRRRDRPQADVETINRHDRTAASIVALRTRPRLGRAEAGAGTRRHVGGCGDRSAEPSDLAVSSGTFHCARYGAPFARAANVPHRAHSDHCPLRSRGVRGITLPTGYYRHLRASDSRAADNLLPSPTGVDPVRPTATGNSGIAALIPHIEKGAFTQGDGFGVREQPAQSAGSLSGAHIEAEPVTSATQNAPVQHGHGCAATTRTPSSSCAPAHRRRGRHVARSRIASRPAPSQLG